MLRLNLHTKRSIKVNAKKTQQKASFITFFIFKIEIIAKFHILREIFSGLCMIIGIK